MAVFRFALQRLLDQRELAEKEKQRAVAVLERRRVELEQALRSCQETMSGYKQTVREELSRSGTVAFKGAGAGVDAVLVRMQGAASLGVGQQAHRLAVGLAGVLKQLEKARQELAEAAVQRRSLELLRDRRRAAWLLQRARREANLLDDMVCTRAAYRSVLQGEA